MVPGARVFFVVFSIALAALLAPRPAAALRCDDRVVTTGDHAFEVRARCGEPYWVEDFSRMLVAGEDSALERRVEQRLEAWYYNFGPNQLMRRLVFQDNRLVREETLSYGYRALGRDCDFGALMRGTSTGEVVARCGLPQDRDSRYAELVVRDRAGLAQRRLVRLDEWLYPAGQRDPYLLRFNDGVLETIERIDR